MASNIEETMNRNRINRGKTRRKRRKNKKQC
jgi:hypothetical protein